MKKLNMIVKTSEKIRTYIKKFMCHQFEDALKNFNQFINNENNIVTLDSWSISA